MNYNSHFKKVIKISAYGIAIIFILWFIISPIHSDGATSTAWKIFYRRFATIISVVSLFWLAYYNVFWKLKARLLRKLLFDQPNLSGTWMGYLKSDYGGNETPMKPIKIVFFIRQTSFFDIRIISQSSENAFFSFGETLQFDPSNNLVRLLYQYSQKKTLPDSKDDQQGSADLYLYDDYLAGHYWTIVKTSGFIRVHKLSDKLYRSFEDANKEIGEAQILQTCYNLIEGTNVDNLV